MSQVSLSTKYRLRIRRPSAEPEDYAVGMTPVLVGRVKANNIVILGDSAISREHCAFDLDRETGKLTIRDLGSSNGTFMNGQSVGALPVQINVGDVIQVGSSFIDLKVDKPSHHSVPKIDLQRHRFGVPLPPQPDDKERTVFQGEICTCGRCGSTISTRNLSSKDKVGCARCRAVWQIP